MATKSTKSGFSEAEREAMKARAEELRSSGKGGKKKAEDLQALVDKVAEMPDDDRAIAEEIHRVVTEVAPDLLPKTWYGMPAYTNAEGKVLCFFKPASKFGMRYPTFGFQDSAALDDGSMWATEFAITSVSDAETKKIKALVKKAVG